MKSRFTQLLAITICLLNINSSASADPKKINVGYGTYGMSLTYPSALIEDENFSGSTFIASYALSDSIAIRGNLFSTEFDLSSNLQASGSDIVLLLGTGLENEGMRAYLGAGIFNEEWDAFGSKNSFGGMQLNAGIGYSWEVIVLELFIGLRDASDYETLSSTDVISSSASLSISARF